MALSLLELAAGRYQVFHLAQAWLYLAFAVAVECQRDAGECENANGHADADAGFGAGAQAGMLSRRGGFRCPRRGGRSGVCGSGR